MLRKLKRNISFEKLSKDKKLLLKNRLLFSIESYRSKKRKMKYVMSLVAAAVIILSSVLVYPSLQKDFLSIEKYVELSKTKKAVNCVKLFLNADESIEILENDSIISYSNYGKNVAIGTSKNIQQKINSDDEIIYNTLMVPFGKRKNIILSDGTKVCLNSGSKLVFPAYFSEYKREVYLEGEAIFEVTHNKSKPFFVKASNYNIEVLGTVFNISNYSDDETIKTVLKSGKIKINYKNNNLFSAVSSLTITPNTLAIYNKGNKGITTRSIQTDQFFSWRDGIFIFKNDSLAFIMKKLSRYYNLDIIIANATLSQATFSGYLDVKEDINLVMKTIMTAGNSAFNYKITTDRKLIIK
jgi:hypothetical protein